ncbi:Protein T2 [Cichlidogyrus casuarinus]|uniref:Protein T2 n=1 Tax=Cichlidogyrus casuarinus TaxID=1844966 RepID=A0ABD2QLM7_9PLAT
MLSSSRTLVTQLEVFRIQQNSSGSQGHLEPVTLFLLSDSIEIARPRRKHTGEIISHALKAALAAVQFADSVPRTGGHSFLSRKGSAASNSSCSTGTAPGREAPNTGAQASLSTGIGLNAHQVDSKHRTYSFKHVQFIKLQDIRRIVDLRNEDDFAGLAMADFEASGNGAAFALIICNNSSGLGPEPNYKGQQETSLLGFCLAASVTANYAVQHGRCPEPVENAVIASSQSETCENLVATLQLKVDETKRCFLRKLSSLAVQVSCLAPNPEELLAIVDYDAVFSVPLKNLLSNTATGFKSKKFVTVNQIKFDKHSYFQVQHPHPDKLMPRFCIVQLGSSIYSPLLIESQLVLLNCLLFFYIIKSAS